jgi:hypothetical protein
MSHLQRRVMIHNITNIETRKNLIQAKYDFPISMCHRKTEVYDYFIKIFFALGQAMKAQRGSRDVFLIFL